MDVLKGAIMGALRDYLDSTSFKTEVTDRYASTREDESWTLSIEVSPVTALQAQVRVREANGAPRYFNVKLTEMM